MLVCIIYVCVRKIGVQNNIDNLVELYWGEVSYSARIEYNARVLSYMHT